MTIKNARHKNLLPSKIHKELQRAAFLVGLDVVCRSETITDKARKQKLHELFHGDPNDVNSSPLVDHTFQQEGTGLFTGVCDKVTDETGVQRVPKDCLSKETQKPAMLLAKTLLEKFFMPAPWWPRVIMPCQALQNGTMAPCKVAFMSMGCCILIFFIGSNDTLLEQLCQAKLDECMEKGTLHLFVNSRALRPQVIESQSLS
jgi:hypothetical protein